MKIAILGGTGYIGKEFSKFVLADCYSSRNLDLFLDKIKEYDVVYHLADARMPEYTDSLVNYYKDLNSTIRGSLRPDTFLVYNSSCSIYGLGDSITELSDTIVTSLYSKSKLISEEIFKEHPNTLILRMGTVFGDSENFRGDLLINSLVKAALQDKPIDIFSPNDYRPFLYMKDACRILSQIYTSNNVFRNKTVNLVSFNITKFKLVETIVEILGKASINYSMNREKSVRNYVVSNQLSLDLGIEYKYRLEGAIEDFVNALSA